MRRFLMVPVVLLLAASLAGCATGGGGPATPDPISQTDVQNVIKQVQDGVATSCKIAVTASSVASVLSAFGVPYVGMVTGVVNQLCGAFNRAGANRARAGGPVKAVAVVNGRAIRVQGKRLR